MFESNQRRAVYVYMKHINNCNFLKKYGRINYVSKKQKYISLYMNENDIDENIRSLKRYNLIKDIKISPLPDIEWDFNDSDSIYFSNYD